MMIEGIADPIFISAGDEEFERDIGRRLKDEFNQRRDDSEVNAFIDPVDNDDFVCAGPLAGNCADRVINQFLELFIQVAIRGFRQCRVIFDGLDDLEFNGRRSSGECVRNNGDDKSCIVRLVRCSRTEETRAKPVLPVQHLT